MNTVAHHLAAKRLELRLVDRRGCHIGGRHVHTPTENERREQKAANGINATHGCFDPAATDGPGTVFSSSPRSPDRLAMLLNELLRARWVHG